MSDDAIVQQVVQAELALYRAMIAKDFAALERMLSPGLVYVHSTAVAESRQEYLAALAKGAYEYESIVTREAQVRLHAPVALIDGICDMRVGMAGRPKDLIHLRFVLAWINDGAAWRLEHRHAIRMSEEA